MDGEFEATVAKIMERTLLTSDEVLAKIWKKHEELGFVTWEGAARLVAEELGVVDEKCL